MPLAQPPTSPEEVPTVAALVRAMDREVAGLEQVKQRMALVLRRHMLQGVTDHATQPPNILVIGPSGSGKTWLVQTLLGACPAPALQVAATQFTDTGYMGTHLPSIYWRLANLPEWRNMDGEKRGRADMVPIAERFGVVVLDEFDKLRKDPNPQAAAGRLVGPALQAELLTIVEGTTLLAQMENSDAFPISTHGILHIGVGAFQGLNEIVSQPDPNNPDGLPMSDGLYLQADDDDLVSYGFLEELVGRFATIIAVPSLAHDHLVRVLDEHVLPRYRQAVADDGMVLVTDDNALFTIANMAIGAHTGARALQPILEYMLGDAWSKGRPGLELVLTGELAHEGRAVLRDPALRMAG